MTTNHSEFLSHFPTTKSDAMVEFSRDTVFLASRYLFVWRVGKVQMAFCTHCRTEYPLGVGQASFKHNEKTKCLSCSSECTVKQNGLGRKHMIDDAYFLWYDKSVVNPSAIIATAFYAKRDYSGDYRTTETTFHPRVMYVFEPESQNTTGRGRMLKQDCGNEWKEAKEVSSFLERVTPTGYWYSNRPICYSEESIKAAVSRTPFQYSTWEVYEDESFDRVKFFALAAKYPCVEYLTKNGTS